MLTQRRSLSRDGVVVVALTVEQGSLLPAGEPLTVASGFMEEGETGPLFEELALTSSRSCRPTAARRPLTTN